MIPDGFVVTLTQADTWTPLKSLPYRVHGNVTVQCPRANDPSAGVKLIPRLQKDDSTYPGVEMGPLDREILQHQKGVELSEWGIRGSHVGDQVVVQHGGAG